jgi:hypothetical protein
MVSLKFLLVIVTHSRDRASLCAKAFKFSAAVRQFPLTLAVLLDFLHRINTGILSVVYLDSSRRHAAYEWTSTRTAQDLR